MSAFPPIAIPASPARDGRIPLSQLRRGERALIETKDLPAGECRLLAAMGLAERCEVRVCRAGTPCIVEVESVRLGIGREVAERILTLPCECAAGACRATSDGTT